MPLRDGENVRVVRTTSSIQSNRLEQVFFYCDVDLVGLIKTVEVVTEVSEIDY